MEEGQIHTPHNLQVGDTSDPPGAETSGCQVTDLKKMLHPEWM